jgi:RimJ/RimL family protein N-acetyltransferase
MPGPVFLRDDRVELRTFEEADLGLFDDVYADPEVRQRMDVHTPHTRRREREWLESLDEANVQLLVCPADDPERAVGLVNLFDVDGQTGTAEVGAALVPDARGHGYATAACGLVVASAFDERRLHRLRAETLAVNEPARATLERLGFTHEGTTREATLVCGDRVDRLYYGLLAREWREGRADRADVGGE